jgi:hypothetical protein
MSKLVKFRPILLTAYLISCCARATSAAELAAPTPDFSRDIRPILSENCFQCHGPDENAREAELRLDTREGLFADRGGYQAVVPGDLGKSDLFYRITSDDPDEIMPPRDSKNNVMSR